MRGFVIVGLLLTHFVARAQTNHSYAAKGVVEKIAPDLRAVTIHHQAIAGYMMEMTMNFPVHDTNELQGINPQDEITFSLKVSDDESWVENIHCVGHSAKMATHGMTITMDRSGAGLDRELKPGDAVPDYFFTSEDGKTGRLSDFRGKAVAFTFFFTRCPLPDYCPRMNRNFSETRGLLLADTNAPSNWQFLSISFDPENDTPEILANYAAAYRGSNSNGWLFASLPHAELRDVGARLDLMVMQQAGSISHNLRTVVLDTNGVITRQFDNNEWAPRELADALIHATGRP